jgi:hypothetical protein
VGYDRAAAISSYSLTFDEYEGLVVRVRGKVSLAGRRVLLRALPTLRDPKAVPAERAAALDAAGAVLAQRTISWTLEWEGRPVPTTHAGLRSMDDEFVAHLVGAWLDAVVSPPVDRNVDRNVDQAGDQASDAAAQVPDPALASVAMLDIPDTVVAETGDAVADAPNEDQTAAPAPVDAPAELVAG